MYGLKHESGLYIESNKKNFLFWVQFINLLTLSNFPFFLYLPREIKLNFWMETKYSLDFIAFSTFVIWY